MTRILTGMSGSVAVVLAHERALLVPPTLPASADRSYPNAVLSSIAIRVGAVASLQRIQHAQIESRMGTKMALIPAVRIALHVRLLVLCDVFLKVRGRLSSCVGSVLAGLARARCCCSRNITWEIRDFAFVGCSAESRVCVFCCLRCVV